MALSVASKIPLPEAGVAASLVASSDELDGLVANHVFPAPTTPAVEVTDAEWQQTFAALVDPLPRLVRAVKVNAIAQNLVDNPTYFPEEIQRNPLVAVYQPVADL